MRFGYRHGTLLAAIALGIGWPIPARSLDCPFAFPALFEPVNTAVDPARSAEDLEARAALANLSPIVFSGRLAELRELGGSKIQAPVELLTFKDVRILRGKLSRTGRDGKAVVAHHGWCDGTCPTENLVKPGALLTIGMYPASDVVKNVRKVVYRGRVDGEAGPCGSFLLSRLQLKLIAAPPEEIARLERKYPLRKRP